MNLVVDYTSHEQFSVGEMELMQDLNEITFIVPIFLFFQDNFRLLLNYVEFLRQRPLIRTSIEPVATEEQVKQLEEHSVVLVRGSFDHMHLGHQVLLLKAIFSTSHKLVIEVKDDSIMNNKKLKELIQPVEIRKENIKKFVDGFVKSLKPQLDVKVQTITEPYGSAPYTKGIDAVVITQESLHSLKHINNLRKSNNGLKKVQMIVSPIMTSLTDASAKTKQQRVDAKISSRRIREFLLKANNFTLSEYLDYRAIWDSLVKEINSLCRIKDVDFIVVERWWERIVYKNSRKTLGKKTRKNNHQIYLQISQHNNVSTPNQHSLNEIATNMALLFDGIQEEEKSLQAVVKNFLQSLLKKKGKTKTCKKIRKMIINDIKEFVQKNNPKKTPAADASGKQVQGNDTILSNNNSNETSSTNGTVLLQNRTLSLDHQINEKHIADKNNSTTQQVAAAIVETPLPTVATAQL